MWTLVYMAKDQAMTIAVCAILKENDIIFKCREMQNSAGHEILVPDAEVEKAQELILESEIN